MSIYINSNFKSDNISDNTADTKINKNLNSLNLIEIYGETKLLIDKAKICCGDLNIYDCAKLCGGKDKRIISIIENNKIVKKEEFRTCSDWLIKDMYIQMEKLLSLIEQLTSE